MSRECLVSAKRKRSNMKLEIVTMCDPYTFCPTIHVVDADKKDSIMKLNAELFTDIKYADAVYGMFGGTPGRILKDEEVFDELRVLMKNNSEKPPELIDEACDFLFEHIKNKKKEKESAPK